MIRRRFLFKNCKGDSAERTGLSASDNKFQNGRKSQCGEKRNLLSPPRSLSRQNQKLQSVFPARIVFSFIVIFQILQVSVGAESYSRYKLDDLLLLKDGKKELTGKGRFDETEKEIETKPGNFYFNATGLYRGLTQKGGTQEEQADRSFSRGIASPEVGFRNKGERVYHKILISPFLQYEENVNGTKTTTRGADGELLWIAGWESPLFRIGLEAGRGYQRLDRNGFLFVGFLNYGEFQFHWKPLGITASAIGAQLQNSPLYTERDRNESPRRISGGSVQVLENSIVQNFRIFYYLYKESRQEIVKGDLFLNASPFRPYGQFQYYGFEFASAKFFGLRFDADAIHVTGSRQYGLDAYRSYQTSQSTNANLFGTKLVWERPEASYFLGGFYSSKDGDLRTDRNSDGYAGIRTDPRGYGGKTSFLLMESLLLQDGAVFSEDGTASKPNFENKGIRLVQLGIQKNWEQKWTAQGMIFSSSSPMGHGWEGILTGGYQSEYSYILMSLSYAYVDPQREKRILFEEWRTKEEIREYSRIYLSAGVYF
ncbi:hypothetical protein [Leptospira kmetyi]|uniref:hypothetical protein n=1 Tax=Leptospira kmetyi TaxID=408139 RepID=UPI0010834535|nr:hypothetical protein [Leptospira kmetyi]TGL68643.1 hypothetical protein EHQ67_11265 [Leptospira kmetyi]